MGPSGKTRRDAGPCLPAHSRGYFTLVSMSEAALIARRIHNAHLARPVCALLVGASGGSVNSTLWVGVFNSAHPGEGVSHQQCSTPLLCSSCVFAPIINASGCVPIGLRCAVAPLMIMCCSLNRRGRWLFIRRPAAPQAAIIICASFGVVLGCALLVDCSSSRTVCNSPFAARRRSIAAAACTTYHLAWW